MHIYTKHFVSIVPGCKCNSPSVSSPAWTRLCGRRYKWEESYIRDIINDFGLDANFTNLLRTDHHITQQTLSNNPNTNALSWLQILQCSTSLYTIHHSSKVYFKYWPEVRVNLIRNDGIVPDPLRPGGGGSLDSLTSWLWLLVTSPAHDIFVSDKFRLWFGVAENFSPSQLWSSVSY